MESISVGWLVGGRGDGFMLCLLFDDLMKHAVCPLLSTF